MDGLHARASNSAIGGLPGETGSARKVAFECKGPLNSWDEEEGIDALEEKGEEIG